MKTFKFALLLLCCTLLTACDNNDEEPRDLADFLYQTAWEGSYVSEGKSQTVKIEFPDSTRIHITYQNGYMEDGYYQAEGRVLTITESLSPNSYTEHWYVTELGKDNITLQTNKGVDRMYILQRRF